MHRFVWDLHYPMPAGVGPQYPISATPFNTAPEPKGPWVVPGPFTVRLTANGHTLTQPLNVRMDPRVKSGVLLARQQFALAMRVYDAIADVHAVSQKLAEAEQRAQAAGNADRARELSALAGVAGRGRGRGRGAGGSQPTLGGVGAQLFGVYGLTQQGDGPIAPQVVKAVDDALAQYGAVTARVRPLLR